MSQPAAPTLDFLRQLVKWSINRLRVNTRDQPNVTRGLQMAWNQLDELRSFVPPGAFDRSNALSTLQASLLQAYTGGNIDLDEKEREELARCIAFVDPPRPELRSTSRVQALVWELLQTPLHSDLAIVSDKERTHEANMHNLRAQLISLERANATLQSKLSAAEAKLASTTATATVASAPAAAAAAPFLPPTIPVPAIPVASIPASVSGSGLASPVSSSSRRGAHTPRSGNGQGQVQGQGQGVDVAVLQSELQDAKNQWQDVKNKLLVEQKVANDLRVQLAAAKTEIGQLKPHVLTPEKVQQMNNMAITYKTNTETLTKERDALQVRYAEAEKKVAELTDELKKESSRHSESIKKVREQMEGILAKHTAEAKSQQMLSLKQIQRMTELETDNKDLHVKLKEKEADLREFEEKLKIATETLSKERKQNGTSGRANMTIDELTAKLKKADKRYDQLKGQKEQLEQALKDQQTAYTSLEKRYHDLFNDQGVLQRKFEALKEEHDKLVNSYDFMDASNTTNANKVEEQAKLIQKLQNSVTRLSSKATSMEASLVSQNVSPQLLSPPSPSSSSSKPLLRSDDQKVANRLVEFVNTDLSEQVDQLTRDLEASQADVVLLNKVIAERTEELAKARKELAKAEADLAASREAIQRLTVMPAVDAKWAIKKVKDVPTTGLIREIEENQNVISKEMTRRDDKIASLQQQLVAANQQVAQGEKRVADTWNNVAFMYDTVEKLRAERDDLKAQMAKLTSKRAVTSRDALGVIEKMQKEMAAKDKEIIKRDAALKDVQRQLSIRPKGVRFEAPAVTEDEQGETKFSTLKAQNKSMLLESEAARLTAEEENDRREKLLQEDLLKQKLEAANARLKAGRPGWR